MPRGRRAAQAAPVAANPETASQPDAATPSSRSRISPDDDGELFDFENDELDDGDNSEDQADASQTRHARSVPAANTSNIQVNDPTPAAKKGTAALDIEYFYNRQKGRDTFCKECKQVFHFSHILTCY